MRMQVEIDIKDKLTGVCKYMSPVLYVNPRQLKDKLCDLIDEDVDFVVLFTAAHHNYKKSIQSSEMARYDIMMSLSFLWRGNDSEIDVFNDYFQLKEAINKLGGDVHFQGNKNKAEFDLHYLLQAVDKSLDIGYVSNADRPYLIPPTMIFYNKKLLGDNLSHFEELFRFLLPFFDLYKNSSIQVLNKSYRGRFDEVDKLIPVMTNKASETASKCMECIIMNKSFAIRNYTVYEYSKYNGGKWVRVSGNNGFAQYDEEMLLDSEKTYVNNKISGVLLCDYQKRFEKSCKTNAYFNNAINQARTIAPCMCKCQITALKFNLRLYRFSMSPAIQQPFHTIKRSICTDKEGCIVFVFPFRPPLVDYVAKWELDGGNSYQEEGYQLTREIRAVPDLMPGDVAIIVRVNRPHSNILHTLLWIRSVYYLFALPRMLASAKRYIDNIADSVPIFDLNDPKEGSVNPWDGVARICDKVIPVLGNSIRISVGINKVDSSKTRLERIYLWDHDQFVGNKDVQNPAILSLIDDPKGVVARTFLFKIKHKKKDDFTIVRDVNKCAHYFKLRESTASEYCKVLWYRDTPIGTINYESDTKNKFRGWVRRLLDQWTVSIERYIERMLSIHDAKLLSVTASCYYHLHRLKDEAEAWGQEKKEVVEKAIESLNFPADSKKYTLCDFQCFMDAMISENIKDVPGPARSQIDQVLRLTCNFDMTKFEGNKKFDPKNVSLSALQYHLLCRIARNLADNFFSNYDEDLKSRFEVCFTKGNPYEVVPNGITFLQIRSGELFSEEWIENGGFRPVVGQDNKLHHGLYLCGVISRFLGGFIWIGNEKMTDESDGMTVVRVQVPFVLSSKNMTQPNK